MGFTGDSPFDPRISMIVKTTDLVITTDTTLTDDPDLEFPVFAGKHYLFKFMIFANEGVSDSNIKTAITVPANETREGLARAFSTFFTAVTVFGASWTSSLLTVEEGGFLQFALIPTEDGTVHIQFAQSASQASATTVFAGSSMLVYQFD